MTISSGDYAALSDDAYKDRIVGRRKPGEEELVVLDGHQYKVLEHVNNHANGYQGTIYQRIDTDEIIVAHRGTEQIIRDAVLTDGGMVLARVNAQASDAIEITRRATVYAENSDFGHVPQVTVTGHSLGGTLAQISAHHFDLKGETFNAYGAASLGYRIPEGGSTMLNHVMAADPVSAASSHFGQVRVYATQEEIRTLGNCGFSNSAFRALIPDSTLVAAAHSIGSHKLGNFLGNESVLGKPEAQALARDNGKMIEEYRGKLEALRGSVTTLSRGGPGAVMDLYDRIRGPLDPGEPARREVEKPHERSGILRMDDSIHPGHSLFLDAQRGVHAQDARVGRTPDHTSNQLAGALAAEMHVAGGKRIDVVAMNNDASRTFAVQGDVHDPAHLRVSVETLQAMNTSLEQSTRHMEQRSAGQRLVQEHEQQIGQVQTATHGMHA
ncbi:lipase [Stenotrophomonas daejeonensis]|uniref:Lipase n=1 Tax=Stenotrophomonas daejeonensis TaxID=659018 RepID=A0A0R0E3R2_9GAMM|nr:XVIPCD domain-containing protein [Stenotrophomonas daejeonensis]KRG86066.1 lipase [Stenotrophomonas daejeonensis]